MELVRAQDVISLRRGGSESRQLLFPGNSSSTRVTITRVSLMPGQENAIHTHDTAEQIWHVLAGSAVLLLAGGRRENVRPGDTVRFSDGEEHGAINDGAEPFVYFSVTAPPLDFRPSYATGWGKPATANVER